MTSNKSASPLPDSLFPGHSFERLGNSLHFKINDYRDLDKILELDEALWVASTAPLSTIKADRAFLNLLDNDNDGRLRAEEIKDGIRFMLRHLTDYSTIDDNNTSLPLAAIATETELGSRILSSAKKVLARLQSTSTFIELSQVRKIQKEVEEGGLDQAGIVLGEAAESEEEFQFIKDILKTVGGRKHSNGKDGVDSEKLTEFMDQCCRYLSWKKEAGPIGEDTPTEILPLGTATAKGYELFHSMEEKFNQYFLLCNIKKLNPKLLAQALETPETNIAYNLINIENAESYLQNAPLSFLDSGGTLELAGEINPYFGAQLEQLKASVITPLLGEHIESITAESVDELNKFFAPFVRWNKKKPPVQIDILEEETVQQYVNESSYEATLKELIAESYETAFILENLRELERLVLYQAYMLPLVNSFISFPKLYNPDQRALFEEGTLVMDGRHFSLAVKVEDRAHHIVTSKGSNIFVLYCELYGGDGSKSYEVAVPVTSGSRGNLHLNKWGIFNDVNGNELHARVVDIVINPISISEAMVDPFRRISNAFLSRLEEFSSQAEEQFFKKVDQSRDKKKKQDLAGGMVAGFGVAAAALGSSFAFITKTLAALSIKTVLAALLVVAALLMIPAGITAYYKLSRRDLSTILEGSGWGINTRMKLTAAQAACFTFRPGHRKPPA